VTDVVITNASTALTNASGGFIFSGSNGSGYQIASVSGNYGELLSSSNYFNNGNGMSVGTPAVNIGSTPIAAATCSSPVYFCLGTSQRATATVDIYIYGYILY